MVTGDRFSLPLRWQFIPVMQERDGSVHWTWTAYTQAGEAAMSASQAFETLSECLADAKASGYAAQ